MVGHSKRSKVKHVEGPLDAKRGAAFSRLVKEITVAASIRGDDPSGNPRLRSVVKTARTADMPKKLAEALRGGGIASNPQKYNYLSETTVAVTDETIAARVLKLHDALEACDGTQNVPSHFELPEETFARPSA